MRNKMLVISMLMAIGVVGCSKDDSSSNTVANVDQAQTSAVVADSHQQQINAQPASSGSVEHATGNSVNTAATGA